MNASPPPVFLPLKIDGLNVYAGFWYRFCAGFIDALILMPLAFALIWLQGLDRMLALVIAIPSAALFTLFNVYFNACRGGTPGKLVMGLRITRPDGSRIGWPEAWRRSAVDVGFAVVALAVEIGVLLQVDAGHYTTLSWINRVQYERELMPDWYGAFEFLQQVWIWSEVVVVLFNARRRAVHDFIAGTVVIHKVFARRRPHPARG